MRKALRTPKHVAKRYLRRRLDRLLAEMPADVHATLAEDVAKLEHRELTLAITAVVDLRRQVANWKEKHTGTVVRMKGAMEQARKLKPRLAEADNSLNEAKKNLATARIDIARSDKAVAHHARQRRKAERLQNHMAEARDRLAGKLDDALHPVAAAVREAAKP